MAYAQWARFNIRVTGYDMTMKHVIHEDGKFYKPDDKDAEIKESAVEGHKITAGNSYQIGACGRSNAAVGTEGSFDMYDGTKHIASYHWSCPWGSKTNTSHLTMHVDEDSDYIVQVTGANLDSGALGNITIKAAKI